MIFGFRTRAFGGRIGRGKVPVITRTSLAVGFLLLSLEVVLADDSSSAKDGWEEYDRYQGITMYRREIPGSSVLAYKGSGDLAGSMAKLVTVILDTPRKREWMSRIREARVLRDISAEEKLEYVHVSVPWPLQDRDFVYTARLELDRVNKKATIHYKSIEDPGMPSQSGKVRAQVYFGTFTLSRAADGVRTHVEAETHADPKGLIPKFLVNIYQKKMPRQSLEGLLAQVYKPDIVEHPAVKAMLETPAVPPQAMAR